MDNVVDETEAEYLARLGDRLRALRRQRQLSLQDVEAMSGHGLGASVLGAYERGDRAISVSRLHRLARLYNVPVDQILPTQDEPGLGQVAGVDLTIDLTAPTTPSHHDLEPITIDLDAVEQLTVPAGVVLARYLRTIQIQRGDDHSNELTVRHADRAPIAGLIGCRPHQVPTRLDAVGVLLLP